MIRVVLDANISYLLFGMALGLAVPVNTSG
jgi:hypothetical protein